MSLDAFWPLFPKTINEKAWQKKKGMLAIKKTGISEKIAEAEEAFSSLKPQLYNRISVDLETLAAAEKASNAAYADRKNIQNFNSTMAGFATHCETKAKEFKSNKLVSKDVSAYLETMAADARKLAADVTKHAEKAADEIEEAKNELGADKNMITVRERLETVNELINDWDEHFPKQMKSLREMARELELLNEEMDKRMDGKVDAPAAELKEPFLRIRDESQSIQDVMLGKKAYAVLKVVKEVRGLTKTIKNKEFQVEVVDPFETRCGEFLKQREELNAVAANLTGDAGLGYSTLQDGLKDADGVMKQLAKFAEIFYESSSPNSVEKTREHVEDIDQHVRQIAQILRTQPLDKDQLRRAKQQGDDTLVKFDTAIFALRGALKTAARLIRGRFEKNPMIGEPVKRMNADLQELVNAGSRKRQAYERAANLAAQALG